MVKTLPQVGPENRSRLGTARRRRIGRCRPLSTEGATTLPGYTRPEKVKYRLGDLQKSDFVFRLVIFNSTEVNRIL